MGKDTIIDAMQRRTPPHPRHYVVTCTTRRRRAGEIDGVSYHFLSLEDFARLRDAGGLLEASEVHGNWYGTPRDQVQAALASGRDAILKIDVQGARKVRAGRPGRAPHLRRAAVARGARASGSSAAPPRRPSDLERRRRDAADELARQAEYDHVVVNETGLIERHGAERSTTSSRPSTSGIPDRRIVV